MAFHASLADCEETSNTFGMNERDRSDSTDTCACPTTAELSKAVSVSLGLDTASSPISNMNQWSSSSAFSDFDPTAESSSQGVSELGATRNMNSEGSVILKRGTNIGEGSFREVCLDGQQLSCTDLLRSGETNSAQTLTRGPVISGYLCKESNLFADSVAELPAPFQAGELLPAMKPYPAYSANPDLCRDPAVWCAYSGRSEAARAETGGRKPVCKYCSCAQDSHGSRQECYCLWYSKGEQSRRDGTAPATAQEYGQVESYQSAVPRGHATFSTIKSEPSVWMHYTDRRLR